MCIAVVAMGMSARFPWIVAANRDEFFDRPALPLGWWTPAGQRQAILAGRDARAGGTWMGLNAAGRFALVTNVRTPVAAEPQAPSRGNIVPAWLGGQSPSERFWPYAVLCGHAPFNVLAMDLARGDAFWGSNLPCRSQRLGKGIHGVSNAALNTPWPKLLALKAGVALALNAARLDTLTLTQALFATLRDERRYPDEALPQTGVGLAKERMLSSTFVRSDDGTYGTRSAMVVVTERLEGQSRTWVEERSFSPDGAVTHTSQVWLTAWPPGPSWGEQPLPPPP